MATVLYLIWLEFVIMATEASHFRGGIITYKPTGNGTEIQINFRISWRRSDTYCDTDIINSGVLQGSGCLQCFSGCTGVVGSLSFKCTDFSEKDDWTSGRNSLIYNPGVTGIIQFGFSGFAWIGVVNGGSDWQLVVTADLGYRSDTGKMNTAPTVDMTPIYDLHYACRHSINIPVFDADGDTVRCRFASASKGECGGVCNGFPANLNSDTCTLTYLANGRIGYYAVALQVEDFRSNSNTPLSSVPVQFLIRVLKSRCGNAPKFISPTPETGSRFDLFVGTRFELNITALSTENTLSDITTVSPVGLTVVSQTIWSVSSTHFISLYVGWTPDLGEDGIHTFCFTAKDIQGQSTEQRCIYLSVVDVNECESNPCMNNATCQDLINHFRCDCLPRFYGERCETGICQPLPSDVIFVLDSSVSMTESDFQKQLEFVSNFIDHITIGQEDLQIAVITFSFEAKIEIYLNNFTNATELKEALSIIKYRPGATFTDKGLEKVKDVLAQGHGGFGPRPSGKYAERFVFVLTDGMSTYRDATKRAAADLKEHYIKKIVAIGIGHQVSHTELQNIASPGDGVSPQYVFSVDNFNSLYTIIIQVVHVTCEECVTSTLSDIILLADGSSYINKKEFQTSVRSMTYLLQNMNNYGAENGARVGVVKFGSGFEKVIDLKDEHSKLQFIAKINGLNHDEGTCDTENCEVNIKEATAKALTLFGNNDNSRLKARKFILLLTNGKFEDNIEDLKELVNQGKNTNGVSVFIIGIGDEVEMDKLLAFAVDPNHVFVIPYDAELTVLDVFQAEFKYSVCEKSEDNSE